MNSARAELLVELDRFVETQLALLLPVEKCWQPSDLLPDLTSDGWQDQVTEWRQAASGISDEVLITLVANMITEEALPSYHAWLSNLETGFDRTGRGGGGMAMWMRGWVSEEKRHGDALARYLYITGRVNMRAVEITTQNLLRNGFDPGTDNDIFKAFIYTAYQERATYVAHVGTGKAAKEAGDKNLAKICDFIAGDEARHERGYERFVTRLFELDPDQCMIALEKMLKDSIVMPSRLMSDNVDPDLFGIFSAITQRNGIYTALNYAQIMDHVVRLWKIGSQPVRSDAAKSAQDYVAALPARYMKMAERSMTRMAKVPARPLSWIFGRTV
jgi:acyl-[acyl-carrier-protein] desaturase